MIAGSVIEPPDIRDAYINLRVDTLQLRRDREIVHTQVSGVLLARVPTDSQFRYGDKLVLRGQLSSPPDYEDFSYRDYLATQGIYAYMPYTQASLLEPQQGNLLRHAICSFKQNALDVVYQLFPDSEASLFAGILLGVQSGIPADVRDALNDTGSSYITAISGFNIAILVGLFTKTFGRWFGTRRGAIMALIGIGIYTLLVDADAGVVRAAIMGWIGLAAHQLGRRQFAVNSLAVTAAVMAFVNPLVLWDVGLQLSFAATIGLVVYAELLHRNFIRLASTRLSETIIERLAGPVSEYFLFTIAATITTLPPNTGLLSALIIILAARKSDYPSRATPNYDYWRHCRIAGSG